MITGMKNAMQFHFFGLMFNQMVQSMVVVHSLEMRIFVMEIFMKILFRKYGKEIKEKRVVII